MRKVSVYAAYVENFVQIPRALYALSIALESEIQLIAQAKRHAGTEAVMQRSLGVDCTHFTKCIPQLHHWD